jgi:hypothetical protein
VNSGNGNSLQLPAASSDASHAAKIRLDKKPIGIRIALISRR